MTDQTTATSGAKIKRHLLGIEISRDELACRVAEAAIGMKRPTGTTAADAIAQLRRSEPETVESFYRIADRAVLYFHECINAGKAPH